MKIVNLMVYGMIRGFLLFARIIPMRFTFWWLGLAARLVYRLVPRRRALMLWNLELALGAETTPEERERIAKQSFINLFISVGELIHMDSIVARLDRQVEFEGDEIVEGLLKEGRGFFIFGGHFGGWMMPSLFPARFPGVEVGMVARPLRNPYLQGLLEYLADKFGGRVITTRGTGREIVETVSRGGVVGLYMDQESRRDQGVFVKFFGREASSHVVPGHLAWKHEIPLVPYWIPRVKPGHFRVIFREPLKYELTDDPEENNRRVTQAIAGEVERTIRERPEQWLWAHNRWRRRADGTQEETFARKKRRGRSKARKKGDYLSSVDQAKKK